MPLDDGRTPTGDDPPRSHRGVPLLGAAAAALWRPASTVGRVFLALARLGRSCGLHDSLCSAQTYLERDARFRIDGASNIQATGLPK